MYEEYPDLENQKKQFKPFQKKNVKYNRNPNGTAY